MDDARTKATLDALADLFLTGPATSSPTTSRTPQTGGEEAIHQFTRRATAIDELGGPRPIRMPPKLRPFPSGPPAAVNPPETAAAPRESSPPPFTPARQPLRLRRPEPILATEPPPETPDTPQHLESSEPALVSPGATELHVEAVFLGNLPGFGGPWLTQYAHRVAQRRGPVVVLHVDEQQIDIDLVTSNKPPLPQDVGFADAEAEAALDRWIDEAGVRPLPELLKGLLDEAPVAAATWLIHLSGTIDQDVRSLAARFNRWRLLCGADELAVNGAQQLLKQLLEPPGSSSEPGRPGPGPGHPRQIGLMVFGADEARSLQVTDRLTAMSQEFLRGPINLAGWQKQMVPVNLRTLGSYLGTSQIWPAVWSLIESHGGATAVKPLEPATPIIEKVAEPIEEIVESVEESSSPFQAAMATEPEEAPPEVSDEALVEEELSAFEAAQMAKARAKAALPPAPPARPEPAIREEGALFTKAKRHAAPTPVSPVPPRVKSTVGATAEPVRTQQPVVATVPPPGPGRPGSQKPTPVADDEPDLTAFLPGGCVPLAARRPRHSQTQLALDEQGVIHLLYRHVATGPDAATDDGLRAAVIDLIETRAWVREHFKLLTLTQRQLRFDRRAKPVLHLFTDQAKLAAALTGRIGQFVRFHLLQRVRVGDQSTWFSTALN